MKALGYMADASTFVSSKYPYKNFSEDNCLCVGRNSGAHYEALTLMRFRFDKYNINPCGIKKANLMLYISGEIVSADSTIGIYANLKDFDEKRVNYLNAPQELKFYDEIHVEANTCKKYITVDITEMCRFWVKNPWYNFGLTLKLISDCNGYYLASSRTNPYPFIVMEHND